MRKSLLIAMADFLVLAALSLSLGMSPNITYPEPAKQENDDWPELSDQRIEEENSLNRFELTFRRHQQAALETNLLETQEELVRAEISQQKSKEKIKLLTTDFQAKNKQLVTKKRSLEKQLHEKEANAERLNQRLDAVKTKKEEALQIASSAEEKKELAITAREETLQRFKQVKEQMDELQRERIELRSELAAKTEQIKNSNLVEGEKKYKIKALRDQLKAKTKKVAEQEQQVQTYMQMAEERQELIRSSEKALNELMKNTEGHAVALREKNQEIARLQKQITGLVSKDNGIWAQVNEVGWDLKVKIKETAGINSEEQINISAPAVRVGERAFLVTDFVSLGGEVAEKEVTELKIVVGKRGENAQSQYINELYYYKKDPRVWFVPLPEKRNGKTWGLPIKNRGVNLNKLLLYKVKKGTLVSSNLTCTLNSNGILHVLSELPGASPFRPAIGDLVVTENKLILGVVVENNLAKTKSECITLAGIVLRQLKRVKLYKNEDGYFHEFSDSMQMALK